MLYKYLHPERVHILKNLKIRFTQPEALNDPFESRPLINLLGAKKIIDDLEQKFQKDLERIPLEERSPDIVDLAKSNIQILKEKASPHNTGQRIMDKLVKKGGLGILSLSKTENNLLMWSHYADNHRGFVIGFDEKHEFFHPKNNQNPINKLDYVRYIHQRNIAQWETDEAAYIKIFFEKSLDWVYEQEVRAIRHFNQHSITVDSTGYPVYLFDLPKECIKCIYIGANASSKLKEEIDNAIKENNLDIDLYELKISETLYDIDIAKVSTIVA